MFLDLLNHAFLDVSMLYFYLGLLFITLGVTYISKLMYRNIVASSFNLEDDHQHIKVNMIQVEKPLIMQEAFLDWLVITFKRMDEKDDKADDATSYFKRRFKIRGGKLCLGNTYLQPLKNIM